MVTVDEIRAFAITLPRSSEGLVRGHVKFRIGRIVWLSLSPDGSTMGFAFPKEWRDALVESEPENSRSRASTTCGTTGSVIRWTDRRRSRCATSSRTRGLSACRRALRRYAASRLPGLPFPGDPEGYPTRDEVIDYLERYAKHSTFRVELNSEVHELRTEEERFALRRRRTRREPPIKS